MMYKYTEREKLGKYSYEGNPGKQIDRHRRKTGISPFKSSLVILCTMKAIMFDTLPEPQI